MRTAILSNSHKALASFALVAAAAGVAGLGTFGAFNSSTSASQEVTAGTVKVELGASTRLNLAASGIVSGDTIQRAVELKNTGNQNFASLTLSTTATVPSLLNSDTVKGLQLKVDSCSTPWTEAGTSPAFTYTCTGTTKSVLATRPVIGTDIALANLTSTGAGLADNLLVTQTLPAAADNTFQGLNSTVGFNFTAVQRNATNR